MTSDLTSFTRRIQTVLLFLSLIYSCQKELGFYSCDTEMNAFIVENKTQLAQLSLVDLNTSDLVFQQAVYRSFSAERKREIWLEKIDTLIRSGDYCQAECAHLEKLKVHITLDYFTKENLIESQEEIKKFSTQWIDDAKSNLQWSDIELSFVVFTLYTNKEIFINELKIANLSQTENTDGTGDPVPCACNINSSYCIHTCISSSCIVTEGCGWLWTEPCNGICSSV